MKRCKLFLGLITLILAIVAYGATKTYKVVIANGYYTGALAHCTTPGNLAGFTRPTAGAHQLKVQGHLLYRYARFSACVQPLYTSASAN